MESRIVGGYRVERLLGGGSFGQVWLGRHTVTRGLAAVKLLRSEARLDPRVRQLFEREVRVIASLCHPHIAPFYDCGDDYLITKYISGTSLRQRLARGLSVDAAMRIAAQIGSALQHAHDRGIVHRDVKPANVLIDDHDSAYLIDFGVASFIEPTPTEPSERAGTPGFAAPEQFETGGDVGAPADQYGLAQTFIAMITGETRPPDDWSSRVPAELGAILSRALSPVADQRWPDVGTFVDKLQRTNASEPVARALAATKREATSFRWLEHVNTTTELPLGVDSARTTLRELMKAGGVATEDARELLHNTGYRDIGWTLYATSERLGPLTNPQLLGRARRVFVLMHGLLCARQVWTNVALGLVTHNPDCVVLTPDVAGFGDTAWRDDVTEQQLAPAALTTGVRDWLRLLGLGSVPVVLVGHSICAVSMMCTPDHELPASYSRVAIAPTFAFCDSGYRKRMSRAATLLGSLGRVDLVRRIAAVRMIRRGEETHAYTDDVKNYFIERSLDVRATVLSRLIRGLVTAKPVRGSDATRCAVLLTAVDPLAPPHVVDQALAELEFPTANVHRFAQGGHFPHCEVQGRPEWTARNIDEMVAILGDLGRGSPVLGSATDLASTRQATVTVETM